MVWYEESSQSIVLWHAGGAKFSCAASLQLGLALSGTVLVLLLFELSADLLKELTVSEQTMYSSPKLDRVHIKHLMRPYYLDMKLLLSPSFLKDVRDLLKGRFWEILWRIPAS